MHKRRKTVSKRFFFLLFLGMFYVTSIYFTFRYKRLEGKMLELVQEVNQKELEIFAMQYNLQGQFYNFTEKNLYIQKHIPKVLFE